MYRYDQLVETLSSAIMMGSIAVGQKLPSIRECATLHNVSLNTVKTAYQILENKGLIFAKPQLGYYVAEELAAQIRPKSRISEFEKQDFNSKDIEDIIATVFQNRQNKDYIDLAIASPKGEEFYPAKTMKKALLKTLSARHLLDSTCTLPIYTEQLRQQIARRSLKLGMSISPEDIIITHGATEAMSLALQITTQPGDAVAVESPTFYNVYPLIKNAGRRVIHIPTDMDIGIQLDALEAAIREDDIKAVITIPSGHNPFGFVMPENKRQKLVALANQHKVAIIDDTIYAELQFGKKLIPNLQKYDQDGWVLSCGSFNKTIAPDFRIGWLEAGRFKDAAKRLKMSTNIAESKLYTETLGTFLENGSYDVHMRHLRRLYKDKRDQMILLIKQFFPSSAQIITPQCGFLVWVELPAQVNTLKLFYDALEHKVISMPGILCSGSSQYNNSLRLTICHSDEKQIIQGLHILGQLIQQQLDS
ncbi:MAG: PLP-dependent aminotransferase family protein [Pseudomonadota bacterium]|nr:PLP-dependent aminotransferase family protein [Pseudomonadota bacterium]